MSRYSYLKNYYSTARDFLNQVDNLSSQFGEEFNPDELIDYMEKNPTISSPSEAFKQMKPDLREPEPITKENLHDRLKENLYKNEE